MNRLKIGEPCAFYYIVDIHEEVRIMPTTKGPLHPSVQQFKEFVNHHPKMVHEVRSGHKTWQQFYEEWYLVKKIQYGQLLDRMERLLFFGKRKNGKKRILELKRKNC